MVWHGRFGYAALTLLLFRLTWGFIGPRYARFSQFVQGPSKIFAAIKAGNNTSAGHNPLGALSVIALISLFLAQGVFGLFTTDDIFYDGPLVKHVSSNVVEFAGWFHHNSEWFLMGLVGLHIGAIAFYRVIKKRDLIKPMILGDQLTPSALNIPAARDDFAIRIKALIVLIVCAGIVTIIANA